MGKHTPGPWAFHLSVGGYYRIVADERLNSHIVIAREIDEEADAELIAAAPDLARALAWLLSILDAPTPRAGLHEVDDRRQELGLAMAAGHAAMKAALGKEEGPDEVEEQVRSEASQP